MLNWPEGTGPKKWIYIGIAALALLLAGFSVIRSSGCGRGPSGPTAIRPQQTQDGGGGAPTHEIR